MALRGQMPPTFKLSVRMQPERGGPVSATVKDLDGLEKDTEWHHLLILVHGFNNAESVAENKYKFYVENVLALGLRNSRVMPDSVAYFHWPGNAAVGPLSITDVAGYPVDVGNALESAKPLAAFVDRLLAARPGMRRISFVGHSLGCRLIADTIRQLDKTNSVSPLAVVSLMAAAVPVALAESGKQLARVPAATVKLLTVHSRDDWVLWLAFPLGQFGAWALGNEKEAYGEAIGRYGHPTGFGESLPRDGNGHGDYWTDSYAGDRLLLAMDATLRALPQATDIPTRHLQPGTEIADRGLKPRALAT